MNRRPGGSILGGALRGVVFGAMAIAVLGAASIASASPVLEICTAGGGCPGLAGPVPSPWPDVPPGVPDPTSGGMAIGVVETDSHGLPQIPLGQKGFANQNYLYLSDPGRPSGARDIVLFQQLGNGDAAFINRFLVFENTIGVGVPVIDWSTATLPPPGGFLETAVSLPANQLLPFEFISGGIGSCTPKNDGTNNPGIGCGFFMSLTQSGGFNTGGPGYIGLSDGDGLVSNHCAGTTLDCDFQDMVIGVRIPEPATLLLLGFGLAGLGIAGWRRKPR